MTETTKQNVHSNPRNSQNSKPTSTRPKGKSRYSQKSHVKKNQKPVAVKRGPVNLYLSKCHGAPATKPAAASSVGKDKTGLGHWRCSECKKSCSVIVKWNVTRIVGGLCQAIPIDAEVAPNG